MPYPDSLAPIYLGTADNAAQDDPSKAEQRLSFELVVLSILGFRTLVGTPFVWQSQPSLSAVSRNQVLFENPAIGPSLTSRPGVESANDYFLQRESDTRLLKNLKLRPTSAFYAEQPGASTLDWRRVIGPQIRVEPRLESVERLFRTLVVNDAEALSDSKSIRQLAASGFGAKFSRKGRNITDYHMLSLAERSTYGHFSRAMIEDELISSVLDTDSVEALMSRTTALFQIANGLAHNASLFTTSEISRIMPQRFDFPVIHRWSVSPINPYLFSAVLNAVGVTQSSWIHLPPTTVARIVSTYNPLRNFALYYRGYLTNRIFDWLEQGSLPTFMEAVQALRQELLLDDKWAILEPISKLPDRKFDSTIAGVVGAAMGVPFGIDPLRANSVVKTIVDTSYRVIDGLGFLNVIRLRALLKRYLSEVGLVG